MEFLQFKEHVSEANLKTYLAKHAISLHREEVQAIISMLGRNPTSVEAHLFNVAWSEHCSYKSSKHLLKKYLASDAPQVVLGPGEDSGIVAFSEVNGKKWGIVLAHESHNHPSQVLPYEGAATGIGGIVRDVYCMGAYVIGVADPLRFGNPNNAHSREIAEEVVHGIWGYGNALGVANLGGDTYYDDCFDDNCLVNVVAVGIVPLDGIIRSRIPKAALTEPFDIILIGKPTDRSGFGGAAFASLVLDEEKDNANLGAVQVPDPFLKRILAIAFQELFAVVAKEHIEIGLKDLGAGGLGTASYELASAGSIGIELNLDLVPLGEINLAPEAILVAETQERFCLACPNSFTPKVLDIFNVQFELGQVYPNAQAAVIGQTINQKLYLANYKNQRIVDLSLDILDKNPTFERPTDKPPEIKIQANPNIIDIKATLHALLASSNIASQKFIYSHYDAEVGGRTIFRPGEAEATLIQPIPKAPEALATSTDGNPYLGQRNPYLGGAMAVIEAVRNVICVGAKPLALSDCLNYGNPEQPEVAYQFEQGVKGLGETARALGNIPIITGNVSFYNASATGNAIFPSPVVCCIGKLDNYAHAKANRITQTGNQIWLVGKVNDSLGGSAFERLTQANFQTPTLDLKLETELNEIMLSLHAQGLIHSAKDVSLGGILISLSKMAFSTGLGVELNDISKWAGNNPVTAYFSEYCGYLIEIKPFDITKLGQFNPKLLHHIGTIISDHQLVINEMQLNLTETEEIWQNGASKYFTTEGN